jgi:hypothetical protein
MRRYLFGIASAMFLSVTVGAAADTLPSASPDLIKLQTMVGNLGYNATLSPTGKSIRFKWQSSNYNYYVSLQVNPDHTLAYAYVDLLTYSSTQLAKLDYVKLFEVNDAGDFFFSMEKSHDGDGEELIADVVIPMSGLTPTLLRNLLQGINDTLNYNSQIWDTSLWKNSVQKPLKIGVGAG